MADGKQALIPGEQKEAGGSLVVQRVIWDSGGSWPM